MERLSGHGWDMRNSLSLYKGDIFIRGFDGSKKSLDEVREAPNHLRSKNFVQETVIDHGIKVGLI